MTQNHHFDTLNEFAALECEITLARSFVRWDEAGILIDRQECEKGLGRLSDTLSL
jgi:hypothetical protein